MNTIEYNRELIEKYPFLLPRNRWTGKPSEDFDYSYTELDAMPKGWREAFGEQLCEELKQELIRAESERTDSPEERRRFVGWYQVDPPPDYPDDLLHVWQIMQIKEKYGTLRLYSSFSTPGMGDIIRKYTDLSERTCIDCGKPATKISLGWISPWCDDCAGNFNGKCMDIREYLEMDDSDLYGISKEEQDAVVVS